MSSKNIETIKSYFEYLKTGNLGGLGEIIDDNIVWHQPGKGKLSKTYQGKQAVFELFGKFMDISKGSFKIDEVKSVMENGGLVAAILRFSATKPGQSISMDGVDLMRVEHGKIKEVFLFSGDQDAEDRFWS